MLKIFEPAKLAKNKATLSGNVSTSELPRLLSEITDNTEISYVLKFDYDTHGRCFIEGQVSCTLLLTCYRCLQSCAEALELSFLLTPISSLSSKEDFPEIYEPIVMQDESLNLFNLIEEEILLSLPLVPKHLPGDLMCVKTDLFVEEGTGANFEKVRENPFKDLKDITKA